MALIPVRCMTCRKVTGSKWDPFVKLLRQNKTADEALNLLGLKAPCCRQTIFAHNDTLERLLRCQVLETENMKASMQATAGGIEDGEDSGGEDG